jgi:hypothetical protein
VARLFKVGHKRIFGLFQQGLSGSITPTSTVYRTVGGVAPPAGTPSLWMPAGRVADLQARALSGGSRWTLVKNRADYQLGLLGTGVQTSQANGFDAAGRNDDNYLMELGVAYLVTGTAGYAQRAGEILAAYCVPTNTLTGDSYYWYRFRLPLVAAGLDWCRAGLTSAQRQAAATWLMDRCDAVWPETTPSRSSGWAVANPANNYFWGFMMAGPAALAATGDDTGSHAVSGSNRPAYHAALALSKWTTLVVPFLNGTSRRGVGEGGGFNEGIGYDSGAPVARFAWAYKSAAGNTTPASHPWLHASFDYNMHAVMPGFANHLDYGENNGTIAYSWRYRWLTMLEVVPDLSAADVANAYYLMNQIPTPGTGITYGNPSFELRPRGGSGEQPVRGVVVTLQPRSGDDAVPH